jgi:dipeptidyl aminopeptidase/acylaminoacyl peptidase
MKHVTKHFFVLGVTLAGLVMGGSVAPVALKAQEVEPPNTHPYGKAWEERRPSEYAKQTNFDASELAPTVLAPTAFANEHRMVFESYRDGQYEIYAADGDGGGAVRLTMSGSSRFPKLRYGAITVAYTFGAAGSRDLRSVRKDGSQAKQLLSGQGYRDVAWSPDGTKLAYALRTATTDVYVANYDFAANAIISETCLTCGSGRNNFEPSWSPDGKQIVFVKASATEPKGALWLMNADGSGVRQLAGEQWWIADVRWSPDGTQVAFDYAPSREAWQRLGALTLATGAIRQVYNPNQDRVDAWMGSWSPDSQMLFYTRVEFVEQDRQLYIGKTRHQLHRHAHRQVKWQHRPGQCAMAHRNATHRRLAGQPATRHLRPVGDQPWRTRERVAERDQGRATALPALSAQGRITPAYNPRNPS